MKRTREHAPHTFAGQEEGKGLAQWLNRKEAPRIGADKGELQAEDRTRKRIAQLIHDLNTSAETFIREGRPDTKLDERIERQLAGFTLKVTTADVRDEGKCKTFAEPRWMFGWYSHSGARVAEMIFCIVRLGERGLLGRVRKCIRCEKWLYAKFNHQRFCGKKCQLAHYQTSEEWKRRRRERYQNR
jgi:hypothetical protein